MVKGDGLEMINDIPTTVNGLLLSRYDHQSKDLQVILDMASILGPRFHLSLLSAVLKIPEERLVEKLKQLIQADILRRAPGISSPVYKFRHDLMQEIIYETILYEDRKNLHKRVAETLKKLGGEFLLDVDSVIGYHLEQSGSREAVGYLLQTAKQSADRYANSEAKVHYHRVLAFKKGEKFQSSQMVDATLGLGEVLRRLGEVDESLRRLQEIEELTVNTPLTNYRQGDRHFQIGQTLYEQSEYEQAYDEYQKALRALGSHPESCQSFSRSDVEKEMGWILFWQGRLNDALQRAEEALRLANLGKDEVAESNARILLASIFFQSGDIHRAIDHAESSLHIRERLGDVWKAASSQTNLGFFYHQFGEWNKAEQLLRQAIYVQTEIGDHNTLAGSWTNLGLLLLDKGELEEALVCMDEALKILPKRDFPTEMKSIIHVNRGTVLLKMKKYNRALDEFAAGLQEAVRQDRSELIAVANAYLAEVYLGKGILSEAESYIKEAERVIEDVELKEYRAEVWRVKSSFLRGKGEFDEAISAIHKAQQYYRELGNEYQAARLGIDEAEVLLSQEPTPGDALYSIKQEVEEALEIFFKRGAEVDIIWAEEVLFNLSGHLDPRDTGPETVRSLTAVIDIQLGKSLFESSSQKDLKSPVLLDKQITKRISRIAGKRNVFLVKSALGYKFVLSHIDLAITRSRIGIEAVEYASEAQTSIAKILNTSADGKENELEIKIGIAIGESTELIRDLDRASIYANISKVGRQAQALARLSSHQEIHLTGQVPREVFEEYEWEKIPSFDDRRTPRHVYRYLGVKTDTSDAEILPLSSDRIIGRDEELRRLEGCFSEMMSGVGGHIIYIEAEAGMGKTRLFQEIIRRYQDDVLFLHGKCEDFRSANSFWPLIEILEREEYSNSSQARRLQSLLGLAPPQSDDEDLVQRLPPEDLRKELFSRTLDFLKAEALDHPTVLVFEDVHDLDLSSIDLLDYIFPVIYESPISIMLIARSEVPGPHRSLVKKAERVYHDRYEHVKISELSAGDSHKLVYDLLGSDSPPDRVLEMVEPFIGHPLSIEEGLRYMVEGGWLWKKNGEWKDIDSAKFREQEMPSTFRDLLLRRLNFLDHDSIHILQAGALLGEIFERDTLSKVVPRKNLDLKLHELKNKGWLYELNDGDRRRFSFKNTLVRESVYSTLVRSKRQLLHQRAAETIETIYKGTEEEKLELLAYHYENSGVQEKALHYNLRAAEKCAHRFAMEESQTYFQKAKHILSQLNRTQSGVQLRVHLGLADVHINRGEPTKAVTIIQELLQARTSLTGVLFAACMRRMGEALHLKGNMQEALDRYNLALEQVGSGVELELNLGGKKIVSAVEEFIEIHIGLIKVHFDLHNHEEANELADQVLQEEVMDRFHDKLAEIYNLQAGIFFRQGELEKAQRQLETCLAIYQMNNNRSGISSIYANLGVLAASRDSYHEAKDNFLLAIDVYNALGDSNGIATLYNNLGQLELDYGEVTSAIERLQKSTETARRAGLPLPRIQGLANLGYGFLLKGEIDSALDILQDAESIAEMYSYKDLTSEVLRKQAECHAALGEFEKAEKLAGLALDAAREVGQEDIENQAMKAMSRTLRLNGKSQRALDVIREAWERVGPDPSSRKDAAILAEYALCLYGTGAHREAKNIATEHLNPDDLIEPEYVQKELRSFLQKVGV